MKTHYTDKPSQSIADVSPIYFSVIIRGGFEINRINVPLAYRGQGIASMLLNEILADADKDKWVLYLIISPSDGLDYNQLKEWYCRHGFKHDINHSGYFIRQPN